MAALAAIPRKARTTSLRKWRKVMGMLRIITPVVYVSRGMFTRVQYDLKRVEGRQVQLTTDVHNKLKAWRELVRIKLLTRYIKVLFHKTLHNHLIKFLRFKGAVNYWASIGGGFRTFLFDSLCLPHMVKYKYLEKREM